MGVGSTAVSLATTDGAATVGPRRIPLGCQSIVGAAAIGYTPNDVVCTFSTPYVVPPGCFAHIILKQLNGAATASQVIRGTVRIEGYFE